jgi:hypothetical protein
MLYISNPVILEINDHALVKATLFHNKKVSFVLIMKEREQDIQKSVWVFALSDIALLDVGIIINCLTDVTFIKLKIF